MNWSVAFQGISIVMFVFATFSLLLGIAWLAEGEEWQRLSTVLLVASFTMAMLGALFLGMAA